MVQESKKVRIYIVGEIAPALPIIVYSICIVKTKYLK